MSASTMRRMFSGNRLLTATAAAALLAVANVAWAANADSAQTVECLLPGQIHNVGGHPTMGPRRPIRTTPAECRERGGEYTVPAQAVAPAPPSSFAAGGNDQVRCLIPRQLRQLGERKRYYTRERIVNVTRARCLVLHGRVQAILSRVQPN